ncbi:ABC transporter permease [Amorphus coralli]|uniref:ABC transporter permease n=1 Tax=Amorphus coralli TaxID=340680 RepID=UPI000406C069|nr:ABC transporter permease [Amorphus coralli]
MATVRRRGGDGLRPWAFVVPALLWTVAFFCAPFVVMAAVSLWERVGTDLVASWSFVNYAKFFARPHFLEAMANSLEVTAIVTVLSILLAYPLAWILAERVPERWQRIALICAILPFWTSYVVRSYAWLLVLANNGVINQALTGIGLIDEPLSLANSRTATVIGFVHFFVMLLTLTIYANLKQLPKNYARAAADLGASRFATFVHVILPLTLPGIMVGAFLTFVLCIGDYITPQILGGNSDLVMPQLIMLQIGRRADFPTASALAILLMVVVTLVYIACARWLKLERA